MSNSDSSPTSISAWKKASTGGPAPLKLPSGNVALVRVPGPAAFLAEGLIPNTLLPLVQGVIENAEKGKPVTSEDESIISQELLKDPNKVRQVFEMADAVTIYCVVEPPVSHKPEPGEERNSDLLYVDEVDLDDKMFIMSVAMGGSRDLRKFRREQGANVDALRPGKNVASPAKRAARARR